MDFEKGKVTNEFSALSLYEGALIFNTFSSKCYCERTTFVILYTKHKCDSSAHDHVDDNLT